MDWNLSVSCLIRKTKLNYLNNHLATSVVKVGTKVKNIRLVEGDHDIDCKIEGIEAKQLKSEFVKKA